MFRIALFLLPILFLLACRETETDFDLPFEGEKMILNATLDTKQPAVLNITHTFRPKGIVPDSSYVPDALVKVFENNQVVDTLRHTSKGNYVSVKNFRFREGYEYRIEATASKYPKAFTPVLKPINEKLNVSIKHNKNDSAFKVINGQRVTLNNYSYDITINDSIAKGGFYLIYFELNRMDGKTESAGLIPDALASEEEVDLTIGCKGSSAIVDANGRAYQAFLFSENCLLNKAKTLSFGVSSYYPYYIIKAFQGNYSFKNPKIHILKLNNFQAKKYSNPVQPSGTGLLYMTAQPTVTNITGGYGFVDFITKVEENIDLKCEVCVK